MDSSGFLLLVKNFTNLTEAERAEVGRLSREYPYSQIVYLLHARAAQDLQSSDRASILNQSAVYSTDRSILKWVMTTSRRERHVEPATITSKPAAKVATREQAPEVAPKPQTVQDKPMSAKPSQPPAMDRTTLTGDALRSDIYLELEKLQKNKHDFEESYNEFQKSSHAHFRTGDIASALKEPGIDPLIEEIKTTKRKLKVESSKQREQNEIIDKFIQIQPVIPKPKPAAAASDLSEESAVLSDNIISETLVDILIKQGKNDKAIEVLKKLIWKFPQKKAYFAAQIENLKN